VDSVPKLLALLVLLPSAKEFLEAIEEVAN